MNHNLPRFLKGSDNMQSPGQPDLAFIVLACAKELLYLPYT